MKNLKVILIAFALIFFASCGKLPESTEGKSSDRSVTQTRETAPKEKVTEQQTKNEKTTPDDQKNDVSEGDGMNKQTDTGGVIISRQNVLDRFDAHDAFVADFDQDGNKEAYIIRAHEEDIEPGDPVSYYYDCTISFVDHNGKETTFTKSYGFPRGLFQLENETIFIMEENAQGPGYRSRLFTVKDGAPYEHVLEEYSGRFSPTDQLFGEAMYQIDTSYGFVGFTNDYLEEGGRLDIPSYYDYDAATREFVLQKTLTREEYEAAGENENWENPMTGVVKEQ